MKRELKSNWGRLEEKGSIGRVPKRGVGGYVSRAKQQQLMELGLYQAANEIQTLEHKRKMNIDIV
jgi:hypothetical protein